MRVLTGAVMLAVLSSGPTTPAAATPPVTTAPVTSVAVKPVLELETTAIYAEPTAQTAHPGDTEQPVTLPLTSLSVLSGRPVAAAPGERAPPRL